MSGRLEYRLLGPVEVLRDGRPVDIRAPRLRGLLAALLLNSPDIVSTDLLIDALWGEDVPETARTALQVHVSRLRKLLAPDTPLETVSSGYRLRVELDQVDVHRFERLIDDGRASLASGQADRAHLLLTRALELWRGQPLENVELPGIIGSAIATIGDRHRVAVILRLEAELALGDHDAAVPELARLHTDDPLDERLAELLAVALYRSARQADALAVLTRVRRQLSAELGIEPGPSLIELEGSILRQDSVLDAPAIRPSSTPRRSRAFVTALVCLLDVTGVDDDPEIRRAATTAAFETVRSVVETHGGTIHDVGAVRLVALFGAPRRQEDDAARAMSVAERILELIHAHTDGDPATSVRSLEPRLGVATGEVLAIEARDRYELLSTDPIDEAHRLADLAAVGEIRAAAGTRRLLGLGPDARRARLGSRLVGRTHELGVLRETVDRVMRSRAPSLVTIMGPPGVGKSRLVEGFLDDVSAAVAVGRCLPYGRDITFWPVTQIVYGLAHVIPSEPPDAVLEGIARVAGADADGIAASNALGAVLGISAAPLVPDEVFWAIRRFLERASEDGLIVVFEDLHWAQPALLDLVEHLTTWSTNAPLMFVCTARAELLELRPAWGSGRVASTTLPIGPLSRDVGAELVSNMLDGDLLEHAVCDRVLDTAEGNPLFLEELITMLIDEGAIVRKDEGQWVAVAHMAEISLPETVHAVLGARIDHLPPDERDVLERAAIVGKEFSDDDLTSFGAGQGDDRLSVAELVRKDFLVPTMERPGASSEFRFRHILLHDAAYRGISMEDRANLHERFAVALEARVGDRLPEMHEIVAYHVETAYQYARDLGRDRESLMRLAAQAAPHLLAAARRAYARGDTSAATGLSFRLMDLVDDDDPVVPESAWIAATALTDAGRPREADDVITKGLRVAEARGDKRHAWRLRIERWDLQSYMDPDTYDYLSSVRFAQEAVEALGRLGDSSGRARALRFLGDACFKLGRYEEATQAYGEGQRIAHEIGDVRETWERPSMGVMSGPLPVEECLQVVRDNIRRSPTRPEMLSVVSALEAMAGRAPEARKALQDALNRAEELGATFRAVSVRMYGAVGLLTVNDAVAAERTILPAIEELRAMGEHGFLSTSLGLLAEALYRQGRHDEALRASVESEELAVRDDIVTQFQWRSVRAKLLAVRGRYPDARQLAEKAVELASEGGWPNMRGDAYMDLAEVLAAAGERRAAAEATERAREIYSAKGIVPGVQRAERFGASLT